MIHNRAPILALFVFIVKLVAKVGKWKNTRPKWIDALFETKTLFVPILSFSPKWLLNRIHSIALWICDVAKTLRGIARLALNCHQMYMNSKDIHHFWQNKSLRDRESVHWTSQLGWAYWVDCKTFTFSLKWKYFNENGRIIYAVDGWNLAKHTFEIICDQ